MQSWAAKQNWYDEAQAEGWPNYYNYFMRLTNSAYRAGIVPHWCKIIGPVGPVLETRRTWFDDTFYIPDITAGSGDTVKVSFLFCAVDLFAEYYEPYDLWVRDWFDFSLHLNRGGGDMDRFRLALSIYGDDHCTGYTENIQSWPGFWDYYYLSGYFKDMRWALVEYEKTIPAPWSDLISWRIRIQGDQELWLGYESDSIAWFNRFQVYHNSALVWERDLGPEPVEDPVPKDSGTSIIRANMTPWARWDRPAPVCLGGENNG